MHRDQQSLSAASTNERLTKLSGYVFDVPLPRNRRNDGVATTATELDVERLHIYLHGSDLSELTFVHAASLCAFGESYVRPGRVGLEIAEKLQFELFGEYGKISFCHAVDG